MYRFRSELIQSLLERGVEVLAVTPKDGATNKIISLGVKWINLPISSHGSNLIQDLHTFFSLTRIFYKEQPDAIINFTIKPVIYGSLAGKLMGVKNITSMITGMGRVFMEPSSKTSNNNWLKRIVINQYRLSMKFNKAVFLQNKEDIQYFLKKKLIKEHQVKRIHGSGVNLEKFTYSKNNNKVISFLMMARLIREKGIVEYVEAARIIKKQYPYIKFKLLGAFDHSQQGVTKDQVSGWVNEGIVDYCGVVEDVRPFLSEASVYVLPTYYKEGIPRSILEALAMGKPVITTDAPGCRETVESGVNGYLVPVRDAKALVAAMRNFIDDTDLIGKMGNMSRKVAESKFDVFRVNETVMSEIFN